jgi:hypothetical protein
MAKANMLYGAVLIAAVFLFVLASIACSQEKPAAPPINLIPAQPGKTPSYWCTWGAQNYASTDLAFQYCVELTGHFAIADTLTEKSVFHDPGWAKYFDKARSDLYLMFDLGWDTTPGVDFDNKRWLLGTCELSVEKFPSCTGTPAERLRKLNELTKAAGWRGAAIWLPSQALDDGNDGKFMEQKELEKFWRTRAEWTRDAGIEYWKIDYGARGGQPEFRKMLTQIAAEVAPGLLVEHGRGSGPLNDEECPWDLKEYNRIGSYRTWGNGQALKEAVTIAKFTDILRTYDVTAYLTVPTTLDRVAQILAEFSGKSDVTCVINCEDEPYIAAVLGCATGILRHPLWRDEPPDFQYDPFKFRKKIDAVTRAVRWHRIAPAFPVGKTENILDKNVLIDTWSFRHGDSWATWMDNRETLQTAPARVARGMPLPEFSLNRGPAPYVICSRNPSGAISVATLPRISTGKGPYLPLVDVSIEVGDGKSPIGVFGKYRSLTLKLTEDTGDCKILAQDLAGDEAIDITDKVKRDGKIITLSGELIDQVGLSAASPGDLSDPGLVLAIKR